ncbi:regulator of G-protein signaling [Acrasis kona]|uniref:Regulator of G-protein signaling n=1 Tax=Acrasis kona TaxID=1008807 RepID=A0AAW2ZIW6_9EUKA
MLSVSQLINSNLTSNNTNTTDAAALAYIASQYNAAIGLYVALCILYIIFLCVITAVGAIKREQRIIKVRGWMLFVQLVPLFIYAVIPILQSFIQSGNNGYEIYCYITIYFFEPMIVFLAVMVFLKTLRHIIITNINATMERCYIRIKDNVALEPEESEKEKTPVAKKSPVKEDSSEVDNELVDGRNKKQQIELQQRELAEMDPTYQRMKKLLRFFKKIITIQVLIGVGATIMISWYIAMSIIIGVNKGQCQVGHTAIYICYISFVGVLVVCCLIMILYDLIANRSNFARCGGCASFWWRDDHYLFRIESVIIGVTVSVIVIYEQLIAFIPSMTIVLIIIYPWASVILYFAILFSMSFALVGFIVTIACIRDLIESRKEVVIPNVMRNTYTKLSRAGEAEVNAHFIDWILDEPVMLPVFQEFAKAEWSVENVLVALEIREYRKIPKTKMKQRVSKAKKIINTFVRLDSPMEVNMSGQARSSSITLVDMHPKLKATALDRVYTEAQVNLKDTCTRFMHSDMYVKALRKLPV